MRQLTYNLHADYIDKPIIVKLDGVGDDYVNRETARINKINDVIKDTMPYIIVAYNNITSNGAINDLIINAVNKKLDQLTTKFENRLKVLKFLANSDYELAVPNFTIFDYFNQPVKFKPILRLLTYHNLYGATNAEALLFDLGFTQQDEQTLWPKLTYYNNAYEVIISIELTSTVYKVKITSKIVDLSDEVLGDEVLGEFNYMFLSTYFNQFVDEDLNVIPLPETVSTKIDELSTLLEEHEPAPVEMPKSIKLKYDVVIDKQQQILDKLKTEESTVLFETELKLVNDLFELMAVYDYDDNHPEVKRGVDLLDKYIIKLDNQLLEEKKEHARSLEVSARLLDSMLKEGITHDKKTS